MRISDILDFLLQPSSALIGVAIAVGLMLLFLANAGRGRSK